MEKTCGTCRFGEPAVRCPFGDHYYDFDEKTENFINGCWDESTDTLEQRYAQLEKVALRMFQKLDVKTTWKDDELDGIEAELERLGVFDD